MTTTTLHKAIQAPDIHGIISGFGPYTTAAARQAQSGLVAGDVGKTAFQVVSGVTTLWIIIAVSGGTATWLQINTTADSGTSDPSTILGAALLGWWRGDAVVQSGGFASQFTDKTGNGNHLTQATGGNQPAYSATDCFGKPALTGNGSTSFMFASGIVIPVAYEMFVVTKVITWTNNARIVSSSGGSGRNEIKMAGSSPSLYLSENANFDGPANDAGIIGGYKRVADAQNNTSSDYIKVGTTVATGACGRTTTTTGLTVFAAGSGSTPANVAIAEIILANRVLTSGERTSLDTYLSTQYDPSLLT